MQTKENRCSEGSVYFSEDRCERVSMVHWQIALVTYLRDTSQALRKGINTSLCIPCNNASFRMYTMQ